MAVSYLAKRLLCSAIDCLPSPSPQVLFSLKRWLLYIFSVSFWESYKFFGFIFEPTVILLCAASLSPHFPSVTHLVIPALPGCSCFLNWNSSVEGVTLWHFPWASTEAWKGGAGCEDEVAGYHGDGCIVIVKKPPSHTHISTPKKPSKKDRHRNP